LKHTICRKIRNFKKQNTIFVSHLATIVESKVATPEEAYDLDKQSIIYAKEAALARVIPLVAQASPTILKLKLIIILNFITSFKAVARDASISTICLTADGIVFIYLMMVKIFVSSYNPQITKARVNSLNLHKSKITLNSGLSMRVGISEAIRMLFFSSFKLLFFRLFTLLVSKAANSAKAAKAKGYKIFQVLYLNLPFKTMPVFNSKRPCLSRSIFFSESFKTPESNIKILKSLIAHSTNSYFYSSFLNKKISKKERTYSLKSGTIKGAGEDKKFNQWLAGLIDGDGCFQLSKKGYASLEIIAHIRDKNCLYQIIQKFGGAVKLRTNLNHLRFRLHHKQGMLGIINAVNGEIRNPIRLLQLSKICEIYKIPVIQPTPLTFENAWFSGFFEKDGSIYLNLKSSQMLITASQKRSNLLNILCDLYGGTVYVEKTSFKWIVFKKSEISKLLVYFKLNPCRSAKLNRINAITKYLDLRDLKAHLAKESTILGKAWKKFLLRWDKWEKI